MSLETIIGKIRNIGRNAKSHAKTLAIGGLVGLSMIMPTKADAGVMKIQTYPVQST